MGIDFSDLLDEDDDNILHPREIFFTLDRAPNFNFPRDIQTEVMNRWFENRAEKDNVIKLNVGSGKTLVGLLLLKSALNEGYGPSLYVSPDKQLAQQVIREAEALGLQVTDDPRDPDYSAGEKICVINIYKLFNGRSVFGLAQTEITIGTIVIDDAHACVSTVTDQCRVTLGHNHDAYKEIFKVFEEDIKSYSESRFLDIASSDPRAHVEIPFWFWHQSNSKILSILHKYRNDKSLQFVFPFIKDILPHCRCILGGQKLEIEPTFPPTDAIPSFRRAKRRIYMTATLADDSVLVTHFGAKAKALKYPIIPSSSQYMGERMILMPQELNASLDIEQIRSLLVEFAESFNVVVIVPSESVAKHWHDAADQVLIGDNVAPGIENLRRNHVGLTILINRYDGIDLPGHACRILALVGLPEANAYSDLVDSEILSESTTNLRRQIERIEQGMGRGVRSNEDYCAVLLLGAKLTRRLRSPEGDSMLTPATRAQLNLSRKIAKKLKKPSLSDLKSVVSQCLDRDANWIKVSKKLLVGISTSDELSLDPAKIALREAFDHDRAGRWDEALETLDAAIDAADDIPVKAWLLAQKARIQHTVDAEGAQRSLAAAHRLEPAVMKPISGARYKKLSATTGLQAEQLIENHRSRFIDAIAMRLYADELCSDLRFEPNSSDKFESAVKDLAWFLGLNSQRPEKEYNEGPDNLWAMPSGTFLVIECKNGVTSESGISKKDAGQLGQSVDWFRNKYPSSDFEPIMIHKRRTLGQGASGVSGMRVIDEEMLKKIRENLRAFAQQLINHDVSASQSKVGERLAQFEFSSNSFVNGFSKPLKP